MLWFCFGLFHSNDHINIIYQTIQDKEINRIIRGGVKVGRADVSHVDEYDDREDEYDVRADECDNRVFEPEVLYDERFEHLVDVWFDGLVHEK